MCASISLFVSIGIQDFFGRSQASSTPSYSPAISPRDPSLLVHEIRLYPELVGTACELLSQRRLALAVISVASCQQDFAIPTANILNVSMQPSKQEARHFDSALSSRSENFPSRISHPIEVLEVSQFPSKIPIFFLFLFPFSFSRSLSSSTPFPTTKPPYQQHKPQHQRNRIEQKQHHRSRPHQSHNNILRRLPPPNLKSLHPRLQPPRKIIQCRIILRIIPAGRISAGSSRAAGSGMSWSGIS